MRSRTSTLARKLARLSRREWADLIQAQLALVAAQLLVWIRPTGRLVTSAPSTASPESDLAEPQAPEDVRADQLALAVERAAENGVFRPLCLVRAVALNRLLEAHGIRGSEVHIGVRLRDGRFTAHAWVEHHRRILGDRAWHVGAFEELSTVRLVDAK